MCYFQIMNIWMLKSISINTITESKMEHFGHFAPAVLEAIYSLCFLITTLFCYIPNLHSFKTFFQLAFIPVLNKQLYDEEQANQHQSDR